jgi:hypothetical protein
MWSTVTTTTTMAISTIYVKGAQLVNVVQVYHAASNSEVVGLVFDVLVLQTPFCTNYPKFYPVIGHPTM